MVFAKSVYDSGHYHYQKETYFVFGIEGAETHKIVIRKLSVIIQIFDLGGGNSNA